MDEAVAAVRQPWVQDVTRDAVRHFAWGVGDNNPLWLDPEHAQRSCWKGILAPPCFAYAVHETTVAPGFDDRPRIYASVDWQWFDVIRLDAQLVAAAQLVDTYSNTDAVTQTGTVEFRNGCAALLARATTTCLRPNKRLGSIGGAPNRRYGDDELAAIERAILSESRRGAQIRRWENTAPGERLGTLTKGPLSIMDIVAWCAGALGVPALDAPVSAGGLVDEAATGPQVTAWFAHLITDWAGDDAFLHRLQLTFARQPGLGSTTLLAGEIVDRWMLDGLCVVQLHLTATSQDDETLASGTALVALASTEHGAVSLPINTTIDSRS